MIKTKLGADWGELFRDAQRLRESRKHGRQSWSFRLQDIGISALRMFVFGHRTMHARFSGGGL